MIGSILASPLALLLAIVGLGVLIIVHEGGHFLVARACGMRVDRFAIGFGPPITQFRRGETVFQVGMIPLGGYVQIAGMNPEEEADGEHDPTDPRLYNNRPVYQRFLTILAGPATNYVFAALTMVLVYTGFGLPTPSGPPMVVGLMNHFPAEEAGVQAGDELISIAGREVKERADVVKFVNDSGGKAVDVVVMRDHVEKRFTITPKQDGKAFFLGIQIEPRDAIWQRTSISEEITEGLYFPIRQSKMVGAGLMQIFQGKQKADFTGPIGIVREMKKQILRGTADGLSIVAFISTLLGFFNLLPLPALDGGRLVFLTAEGIIRRKIPREQTVHLVGMVALLVSLVLITVLKDVPRLFSH